MSAQGIATEIRRLSAESYGHPTQELACEVRLYDRAARVRRGVGFIATMVVGAIVTIPIPGLHFVGPPACLIAAFRLGRRRLRQEYAIRAVRGSCPACGHEQSFSVPAATRFPHTVACSSCRAFLKLSDLR